MPLLNEFIPLFDLRSGDQGSARFPHRTAELLASRELYGMPSYREQIGANAVVEMGDLLDAARRIRTALQVAAGAS